MKRQLIGKGIEPKCAYCLYGTAAADGDTVLCVKKGVSGQDASCRRFQYDPLKREPQQAPAPQQFSADDFSLD